MCQQLSWSHSALRARLSSSDDWILKACRTLCRASGRNLAPPPTPTDFRRYVLRGIWWLFASTNDLITWALATLNAIDESDCKVLEEIPNIISNHAVILNPSVRERSYGFGWTRIQLPGVVGIIGGNFRLWSIKDQPKLGNKNLLMLYHQGSTVGYYTHIALFPDTKSAVIALSSSIALSDPTDWMLRAKIQALFDFEDGQDYVKLVVEANSRQIAQYATLARQVSLKRESCADPVKSIPLEAFVGRYSPIRTKGTEVFVGGHSRNQLEAGDSLRHKETDLYTRNITYLPP